ncbi:hypothetical protein BV20DRAFT_961383 [Pilatotrama ljubarskyi]|nr:hypothetical protein BV20DRAFT_961383 [Pilatotrama ljubarskyi]
MSLLLGQPGTFASVWILFRVLHIGVCTSVHRPAAYGTRTVAYPQFTAKPYYACTLVTLHRSIHAPDPLECIDTST